MKSLFLRLTLLVLAVVAPREALPAERWFVFAPTNTSEPGAIGMADWLEAPAGRHGFLRIDGRRLVFADGVETRFWGTNHGSQAVAPTREEAALRAAWYARMGLNAVRFHKFTWPADSRQGNGIGDPDRSTRLLPALLDRMDYYHAQLREKGIYVAWSHIFGHRPSPSDKGRILAYDEVVRGPAKSFLDNSTSGIVNLFSDLQDLNIELTVGMLEHRNPFTGLRYADDPSLAMIEFQNEDNVWWSAGGRLKQMPTYRARLARDFSAWLRARYGSEQGLRAAWGPRGLNLWPDLSADESWERENIYPAPDRTRYQPEELARSPSRQRLLDCMQFLHERQCAFYERFAAAIRATGYRGVLIASCWKANNGLPHYYNLAADRAIGLIDRHNYFGGSDHRLTANQKVGNPDSMLAQSKLGLLGVGLTQVMDRPFALSEWTSRPPNEWGAEGPPLVAYYGFGLQGWSAAFHFAASGAGFSNRIDEPNVYNTGSPTQVGLFPALARAIHRGDVRLGDPVLPRRRVSLEALARGEVGFVENARTKGDENVLTGTVPSLALAVGRVEIEFVSGRDWAPTESPNLARWIEGETVRSNTGQLLRDTRHGGCFTVDTPATKAVVGFAGADPRMLGDVAVTVESPFAVLLLTARERDRDLASTRSALLTVMARARNTGQKYNPDRTVLLEPGQGPVRMEGVRCQLQWPRLRQATLRVLDHDGLRTARTVPIQGDRVSIDTAADEAIYYELTWPDRER